MTSNTDPLSALRDAIKSRTEITYANNSGPCSSLASATTIVLGSSKFPKSIPTRFKKQGTTDVYSLHAIYMVWLLRDAHVAEYMKQARELGLGTGIVGVTERKHVLDWLEAKVADGNLLAPVCSVGEATTPGGTPPRTVSSAPTTSQSRSLEAPTATPAKRYHTDSHDLEVVKKIRLNEVELQDRNTVLRGIKSNNFATLRTTYAEKLKKLKETSRAGANAAAPTPAIDPKIAARKARNNQPIILISSSPTALITMHNVKKFLEDSTFEPSQEARARAAAEGNARPEDLIAIYRIRTHIDASGKETRMKTTYFVVDSVEALSKFGTDAWERVVCVMTTGQQWQFRPYKWNEPRQLFHNVKGVYISWSNDPPNTKIKDWNVETLKIDPHRRHVDKQVVAHFWKSLDTWITSNKPWLNKS
ncbi:RNA polymerase II-associated protein [Panaeolus papilionaceus]|nr:RNA polymerase II-associated protein [Panaeolus papilionaceus]